MNIYRDIYYNGRYYGFFELRNVEGKFMWCRADASDYPTKYLYPSILHKNHLDHPCCDYSNTLGYYFDFEEDDLERLR